MELIQGLVLAQRKPPRAEEAFLGWKRMLKQVCFFRQPLIFVNNEVDAIAMYVFEFSHKFTKDDLSHMWQNLPPKLGTIAEPALATVKHKLLKNELFKLFSLRKQ